MARDYYKIELCTYKLPGWTLIKAKKIHIYITDCGISRVGSKGILSPFAFHGRIPPLDLSLVSFPPTW